MHQSPQHRPLVESIRTKYFTRTLVRSTLLEHSPEYFTRTLTIRITSLELSHEMFHLNSRTKHFTRRVAQITSLEQPHEVLH
jgi:hypothetical protein